MNSFLQGKKTLAADSLRPPPQFAAPATHCSKLAPGPSPAVSGAQGAHVEVVKEGDKVVRLVVTCTCGERVEIDCLYSAGR
jgi:hypothetical protein